jgi:hypothetical protein
MQEQHNSLFSSKRHSSIISLPGSDSVGKWRPTTVTATEFTFDDKCQCQNLCSRSCASITKAALNWRVVLDMLVSLTHKLQLVRSWWKCLMLYLCLIFIYCFYHVLQFCRAGLYSFYTGPQLNMSCSVGRVSNVFFVVIFTCVCLRISKLILKLKYSWTLF